jgi:hypothetical protein
MSRRLTTEDAQQSLADHVAARGAELHQKYGPRIGWKELSRILEDRAFCRYPCRVSFDKAQLLPGEFAHPVPNGTRPEEGFTMCIHPFFMVQLDHVPYLVLYQLVAVNYGAFASPQDAEAFGAAALNMSRDAYYAVLCRMADEISSCEDISDDNSSPCSTKKC